MMKSHPMARPGASGQQPKILGPTQTKPRAVWMADLLQKTYQKPLPRLQRLVCPVGTDITTRSPI